MNPTQIAEKLAFDLFGTDATPREKRIIQTAIEKATAATPATGSEVESSFNNPDPLDEKPNP